MGLFDFLKPKQDNLQDTTAALLKSFFPKGQEDINAGTNMLLLILNNRIGREEAQNILIKAVSISRISSSFDEARLHTHLSGYCLHHFNQAQVNSFYNYLLALTMSQKFNNISPAGVRKEGEAYVW